MQSPIRVDIIISGSMDVCLNVRKRNLSEVVERCSCSCTYLPSNLLFCESVIRHFFPYLDGSVIGEFLETNCNKIIVPFVFGFRSQFYAFLFIWCAVVKRKRFYLTHVPLSWVIILCFQLLRGESNLFCWHQKALSPHSSALAKSQRVALHCFF